MPRMDREMTPDNGMGRIPLVKALVIADGKAGKTWWAAMAAAGLPVLYMDGDVAHPTIMQLPTEVRRNIYMMNVGDTMLGGVKDHQFLDIMVEWTTNVKFRWNDSQQRLASRKDDPADMIWEIKPSMMDHRCVFILDSWTSLCESATTAAAMAAGVDLATATTSQMRPVYQMAGVKVMQFLQCIRSMRCHVIVLSHPDEYTHTTKPEGKTVKEIKETELVVDWTKMIPKSTSKPNSMQMGKYFTDILWMTTNSTGSVRYIDARISDSKMSGGHWSARQDSTKEYTFLNLVRHLGCPVPSEIPPVDHWFTELTNAAVLESVGGAGKILDGTKSTPIKSAAAGGMTGLFKAKA